MATPAELAKEGSLEDIIKDASGAVANLATSAATLVALFASLYI